MADLAAAYAGGSEGQGLFIPQPRGDNETSNSADRSARLGGRNQRVPGHNWAAEIGYKWSGSGRRHSGGIHQPIHHGLCRLSSPITGTQSATPSSSPALCDS